MLFNDPWHDKMSKVTLIYYDCKCLFYNNLWRGVNLVYHIYLLWLQTFFVQQLLWSVKPVNHTKCAYDFGNFFFSYGHHWSYITCLILFASRIKPWAPHNRSAVQPDLSGSQVYNVTHPMSTYFNVRFEEVKKYKELLGVLRRGIDRNWLIYFFQCYLWQSGNTKNYIWVLRRGIGGNWLI